MENLKVHEKYMQRALDLAVQGLGYVSPNPLVGAVIVHDDKVIGEGWHHKYGEAHAEVNAIINCKEPNKLSESTLYVTLEPCSHHGKTPPCADLIVKNKIPKVVVGMTDPNPQVAGKGLNKLRANGVDVTENILLEDCRFLNRRFIRNIKSNRPYIVLKWAQTADGFVARENYDSKWISNELSRKLVHKWRSEEDGILVGFNTAKYDNPHLTVRDWTGRNPKRIVIDRKNALDPELKLFDKQAETFLVTEQMDISKEVTPIRFEQDLSVVLGEIYAQSIGSILVEGGAKTLQHFIDQNLWDEMRVFTATQTNFEKGIPAPESKGVLFAEEKIRNDKLSIYLNHG